VSELVDIHAHVLPRIDDGPADTEAALALVRAAADAGTVTLAATPHLRVDFPDVHVTELAARCAELRTLVEQERIGVRLVVGAEVSLTWALDASPDELALATYGQRGKDLLIESPTAPVAGLPELLYSLRLQGFRITLAHPERSADFQRNPSRLKELVRQGVLVQVNAEALLTPRDGSAVGRFASELCTEGVAHVIASDGHRAGSWRPVTALASAVDAAASIVGLARARWMAREAPAAIIAGAELPEAPGIQAGRRSRRRFTRRSRD
jgi:protein-tyrosine phosphatase